MTNLLLALLFIPCAIHSNSKHRGLQSKVSSSEFHNWCVPRFPPLLPGARKIWRSPWNRYLFVAEIRDIVHKLLPICKWAMSMIIHKTLQQKRKMPSKLHGIPFLWFAQLLCKGEEHQFLVIQKPAQVICNFWEENLSNNSGQVRLWYIPNSWMRLQGSPLTIGTLRSPLSLRYTSTSYYLIVPQCHYLASPHKRKKNTQKKPQWCFGFFLINH